MEKFKIGDKVEIIGDSCHHGEPIGTVVTLLRRHSTYDNSKGIENFVFDNKGTYIRFPDIRHILKGKSKKSLPPKFLLRYDLDTDPIEEFGTLKEVKARILHLVKNESRLKKDSVYYYKISKKVKVEIEVKTTTTTKLKGI